MESLKRKYFILRTIFLRQIELLIDKYVSFIWSKLVQGVCLQLVVIQNQLPSDFADLHCFLGQLYAFFWARIVPNKWVSEYYRILLSFPFYFTDRGRVSPYLGRTKSDTSYVTDETIPALSWKYWLDLETIWLVRRQRRVTRRHLLGQAVHWDYYRYDYWYF